MKREDAVRMPDGSGKKGPESLLPSKSRASEFPYDRPIMYGQGGADAIWEVIGDELGIGLDDDGLDAVEADLEITRNDFRKAFTQSLSAASSMPAHSLFSFLLDADRDFVTQVFAPEDDSEMLDIYTLWGDHSCGETP